MRAVAPGSSRAFLLATVRLLHPKLEIFRTAEHVVPIQILPTLRVGTVVKFACDQLFNAVLHGRHFRFLRQQGMYSRQQKAALLRRIFVKTILLCASLLSYAGVFLFACGNLRYVCFSVSPIFDRKLF